MTENREYTREEMREACRNNYNAGMAEAARPLLPCAVCGAMSGPDTPRREHIKHLYDALEQALDCINEETPEDCSHEEAKADTIQKIRDARLNGRTNDEIVT